MLPALAARLQVAFLTTTENARTAITPPALPTAPRYLGLLVIYAIVFVGLAAVLMRRHVYAGDSGE